MTTKNNDKSKSKKKNHVSNSGEKLTLLEVVNSYPERLDIKIGAISRAGLLDQYQYESEVYERIEIKPSITRDEFTKILKEYLGE